MFDDDLPVLRRLALTPVVAIVRAPHPEVAMARSLALLEGGITVLEVSLTTPGALDVIARLVEHCGGRASIGAGTVMSESHVRDVASAGATFMVAPHLEEESVDRAKQLGLAAFPGCLTPTEIVRASKSGADAIKIFPAHVWSPAALRGLLEPLPDLRCIPTGGIGARSSREWLAAGAFALGVAGSLATADPREAAATLLHEIRRAPKP